MQLSELEGQRLAGRFQLRSLLGQGGYGAVFEAEQVSMGRRCAVKVMAPHLVENAETVKRFELEARSTSKLTHPNTVVVYDFGKDEETGLLFLAMEYLEGEDLNRRIKRLGPLSVTATIHIVGQMAGSLQDAHEQGLVHRDVKPHNTMVIDRNNDPLFVKVIDFGITKALDPVLSGNRTSMLELTGTGIVLGTPQYMSPEQLRNDPVDGRTDQYSLAISVYRLLTGRTPFRGSSSVDVAFKHISSAPLPLRAFRPGLEVTPEFEQVVLRALSKDREERYPTVVDFARALADAAGEPSVASENSGAAKEGRDALEALTEGVGESWASDTTAPLADGDEDVDAHAGTEIVEMPPEAADQDSIAFDRTLAAPAAADAPVHLGGTLVPERGQKLTSPDDVPGLTMVVLRDESSSGAAKGEGDRAKSDADRSRTGPGETAAIPRVMDHDTAGQWEFEDDPSGSTGATSRNLFIAVGSVLFLLTLGAVASIWVMMSEEGASVGFGPDGGSTNLSIAASDEPPSKADTEGVAEGGVADLPVDETGDETGDDPDTADEQGGPAGETAAAADAPTEEQPETRAESKAEEGARGVAARDDSPSPDEPNTRVKSEEPEPETETVKPARVKVIIVPWGTLYVDGRKHSDEPRQTIRLAPGTYTFELRQNGESRDEKRVTVGSGEAKSLRLVAR